VVNTRVKYAPPFSPLNAELNPICHLLALLGAHLILHVSGLGVNLFWVDNYTFLFKWRFDPIPGRGLLIGCTILGRTPLD